MDARKLTPRYFVSPQISVADLPDIAAAGFVAVICNRPNSEVSADQHSERIAAAAAEAGLAFEVLELTHQTMTPENVARQNALIEAADGPVLAYCKTGTRCSVVWALTQAGVRAVDDILATAAGAGYQLDQWRPALEQAAAPRGSDRH